MVRQSTDRVQVPVFFRLTSVSSGLTGWGLPSGTGSVWYLSLVAAAVGLAVETAVEPVGGETVVVPVAVVVAAVVSAGMAEEAEGALTSADPVDESGGITATSSGNSILHPVSAAAHSSAASSRAANLFIRRLL